jgi:RNA polymerase sigma factor (sigma-70 family)
MTDNELREQLERGHAAAYGWALACCRGNQGDAEDVLHDAYLAVLNGKARFDGRSSFRTWLYSVIRLTATSTRRRAWLRGLLMERRNGGVSHRYAPSVEGEMEAQSRAEHLRALLNGLAARQREVLHLVFYHEMTIEEAAQVMNISLGSARTHYTRGKGRLAMMLNGSREL